MGLGSALLTGVAALVIPAGAAAASQASADAAACVLAAYNRHDLAAERRCFAADAVLVNRRGERHPFDWEADAGYRGFDAVVHARFEHERQRISATAIEVRLIEDNDFLRALGIERVEARWRYVVRNGLVVEAHLLGQPTPAFASALRAFGDWLRTTKRPASSDVLDRTGSIVFNGTTGAPLVALAAEWRRGQGS